MIQAPPAAREYVLDLLQAVKDPEIPVLSLVDLGVVDNIVWGEDGILRVGIVPTFAGCPAIQLMRLQVEAVLHEAGYTNAVAHIEHTRSWDSRRISARGREQLKAFGLAPPPDYQGDEPDLTALANTQCPRCDSTNTVLLSPFGPTLCRAIHHCNSCHETFEQFKPL